MSRLLIASALLCASCAPDLDPTSAARSTSAPLAGVAGSTDSADRQCHVVLRHAGRLNNGMGGYEAADNGSYVFEGVIDVSAAAVAEGALPAVIYQYGSDPTWFEMYGYVDPADAAPADGFVRYHFRLEDHLPGPGMSGTALSNARVQLIPLLHLAEGGRLFDHNRRAGDFETYVLNWNENFLEIVDDAAACPSAPAVPPAPPAPPPAPHGVVRFEADWSETQDGPIVQHGQLELHYALERLTACRGTHNGYPAWDVTAHARFSPGGQLVEASVRSFDTMYGHPYGPGRASAASFDVPADATSVAIWFDNHGIGCQAWDSNQSANYVFAVQAPPSWLGNARANLTRDTSAGPCAAGALLDAAEPPHYDTWVRQQAALRNLCFEGWQPGVTDRDDPEMWKKLDARVHYHFDGAASADFVTDSVPLVERAGNNARWAFDLTAVDPFRPYNCPTMPTPTDGAGYVHAAASFYFTVNGVELRPAGAGSTFRIDFSDYENDPFRATCLTP